MDQFTFWALPAFRHFAQILIFFFLPSIMVWVVCMLGTKRRNVEPVTLCPTPPLLFAIPRRLMDLPLTGFFPQIEHSFDIIYLTSYLS